MHVSVKDHLDTILVTDGANTRFDSYYSTLDSLRPLFQSSEWQSQTTGWYLNVGDNDFTAVRISYFCPDGNDPRSWLIALCHILRSQACQKRLSSRTGTAETNPVLGHICQPTHTSVSISWVQICTMLSAYLQPTGGRSSCREATAGSISLLHLNLRAHSTVLCHMKIKSSSGSILLAGLNLRR